MTPETARHYINELAGEKGATSRYLIALATMVRALDEEATQVAHALAYTTEIRPTAPPVEPPLIEDHEFSAQISDPMRCSRFKRRGDALGMCSQPRSRHRSAQGGEERG